jgi:hypothetical protein
MAKSKLGGVYAVLIALTLFFGGMLSYKILTGSGATALGGPVTAQQPSLRSEGIGIQGRVAIQVYSSSGLLVTSWKGHNALSSTAISIMAECFSGKPSAGPGSFLACSGPWISQIWICPVTGTGIACEVGSATSTTVPSGCDPSFSCTGWQSTATITIVTNNSGTMYDAALGLDSGNHDFDRVNVSPAIALNQGDRAVITITFTIS